MTSSLPFRDMCTGPMNCIVETIRMGVFVSVVVVDGVASLVDSCWTGGVVSSW